MSIPRLGVKLLDVRTELGTMTQARAVLNADTWEVRASAVWLGGSWHDGNGVQRVAKRHDPASVRAQVLTRLAEAERHLARGLLRDDLWRFVTAPGGDAHQRRKHARAIRQWARRILDVEE